MGRRKHDPDYAAYMLRRVERRCYALDRAIAIVRQLLIQLENEPDVAEVFLTVERMLQQQLAFAARAREHWLRVLAAQR